MLKKSLLLTEDTSLFYIVYELFVTDQAGFCKISPTILIQI